MKISSKPADENSLRANIEALLFVAPVPVSIAQLARVLNASQSEVQDELNELEKNYSNPANQHGIRLQKHRGLYQLTSAPEATKLIENFLGLESSSRLSQAALETLSIILYLQPVTRPRIDAIRGVSSDGVLKSLLRKGLVQEESRAESPGRPILYGTTSEILQHFGINNLDELPPLDLEENLALPSTEFSGE